MCAGDQTNTFWDLFFFQANFARSYLQSECFPFSSILLFSIDVDQNHHISSQYTLWLTTFDQKIIYYNLTPSP